MVMKELRILIVEDNPDQAASLKMVMENRTDIRYVTDTAATARDAIEKLKAAKFDAVILDLRLPDKSGAELVKDVMEAGKDVGVLALTGWDEANAAELKKAGVDSCLRKPASASEVSLGLQFAVIRRKAEKEKHEIEKTLAEIGKVMHTSIIGGAVGKLDELKGIAEDTQEIAKDTQAHVKEIERKID